MMNDALESEVKVAWIPVWLFRLWSHCKTWPESDLVPHMEVAQIGI